MRREERRREERRRSEEGRKEKREGADTVGSKMNREEKRIGKKSEI